MEDVIQLCLRPGSGPRSTEMGVFEGAKEQTGDLATKAKYFTAAVHRRAGGVTSQRGGGHIHVGMSKGVGNASVEGVTSVVTGSERKTRALDLFHGRRDFWRSLKDSSFKKSFHN